jgi:glycosyltransferase involved in cell wall biosynthesis
MIILVHSETDGGSLAGRLGRAEYSYYFVQLAFRPVLERIGLVVAVTDPAREVDAIWRQAARRGEDCVYLSFAPPHRTCLGLACPTIPVFAWEFDSLPDEAIGGEPRHDWGAVLRRLGCAIVHSRFTARIVRQALGEGFAVSAIAAPVWDRFAVAGAADSAIQLPRGGGFAVKGTVIDTAVLDPATLPYSTNWVEAVDAARPRGGQMRRIRLDGVVYGSVFNPEDGRKNWADMIAAFCRALGDAPDATLVLKLTHHDGTWGMALMLKHLARLAPFRCRVVLIHGFLAAADYANMFAATTYTVNSSHGEGQCLPLMEAMSAGKPAVAPPHTGMADYLTPACGFMVGSSAEPASWPQDPRHAVRTRRRRIDLGSLERAYAESYRVATADPARYQAMSRAATQALRAHCSEAAAEPALRDIIAHALRGAASGPCGLPAVRAAPAGDAG